MGVKMLEAAARRGIKHIHSHLELEENYKVRAEMEKMGGKVIKVHRVYRKSLVTGH
jgi:phage gp16-like protein